MHLDLSASVGGDQAWRGVKNKRVEEAIRLIVARVALSIHSEFEFEDVRLCVLRYPASYGLATHELALNVDILLGVVSKSAFELRAVGIKALKP